MFIDIHAHTVKTPFLQIDGPLPFPTPEQLIEHYNDIGVEQAVLLPLIGPEFYPGQGNEEILEIVDRFPGRFIPFCNIHPRAINNSPDAPLSDVMKKYKDKGCKGIGEVTSNMRFDDPYILNFLKHVEIAGLPLTFHIAPCIDNTYGLYDDPGLPLLETTLQKYSGITFLGHSQCFWSEIGTLREVNDRAGYPDYPVDAEGAVPKLMRKYPNLYGDLSAGSGCNALTRDPEYAVKFMTEFQDRLMFGLDICSPPKNVPKLVKFLTEMKDSGKISLEIFNKISRGNAIHLLNL
jgi:predicted TIM-barrel fold metal-dependent hydrolase